ncbi:hypothetical protein N0V93_000977 [Gnomoniopsis smithogilvyi]|uniref:Uncharacterized protein n=1 Tax=Gnomoniopsis smithogilvyi TaxID=1191159 RepID=A0A9W9D277_9PEZI|nr:hypothetical protein N0V93_000977 [Gnomoniopsis smithogilvyi]
MSKSRPLTQAHPRVLQLDGKEIPQGSATLWDNLLARGCSTPINIANLASIYLIGPSIDPVIATACEYYSSASTTLRKVRSLAWTHEHRFWRLWNRYSTPTDLRRNWRASLQPSCDINWVKTALLSPFESTSHSGTLLS